MRVWVNGTILDDAYAPVLSVFDHGFTVGDGVFETVKVIDGRPFALRRHLDRLDGSANGLGLGPPSRVLIEEAVAAVLKGPPTAFGRLRITVTGGVGPAGSDRGTNGPTLVVAAGPLDVRPDSTAIVTVPWRRNDQGATAGLKTTSYADNVIALAHARERGASEAVFANTAGLLCEGTGTNVFYARDGRLHTPTVRSGCLAGVTRALVLEWCADLAGGVVEVDEPIDVLATADEIFVTSTTRDVQAVYRCDDRELTAPGSLTEAAQAIWSKREAEGVDP
ncbi:MAG TPA: aminodeoxychorismate lyase [Nocardioidaceae bacterium]|nr:aminodeoxychorismate lyase [Nocardioidaceae bacterium]